MVNAIITDTILSISKDSIPYIILAFRYNNEKEERKFIETPPFSLINPRTETLDNSSMGRTIETVLEVIGAASWENIKGKVVRLDLIDDNKIKSIYNVIENNFIPVFKIKTEDIENELETEEKVEE